MLTVLLLAIGVAADATAVAIVASVAGITRGRAIVMAFCFGGAQALMSAIGWIGGISLGKAWAAGDHWVALVLLSIVGVKMIQSAVSGELKPLLESGFALLVLSLATSIDALAVGVTLATLEVDARIAIAAIGIVTFLFVLAGAAIGRHVGERFGRNIEIVGGVILIGIGITIVVQHLRLS